MNQLLEESSAPAVSETAMVNRTWLISGDKVIGRISAYPDEARETLMWFYHYVRERDLRQPAAAALLKKPGGKKGETYDPNTIYKLLAGLYDPQQAAFMLKAIAAFKEIVEAEQAAQRAPFIATHLTDRVHRYCDACISHHRIGIIYGDSQIGKTDALLEFQRQNNHGRTIYIRVPAGGYLGDFVNALGMACGISIRLPLIRLKRRILDYIRANNLLIVDELHQCFTPVERTTSYHVIEFIREIFDRCKCAVVLCATNILREMLEKSGVHRKIADQLRKRGLAPLILENVPLRRDLDKFAAHYGLSPATGHALDLQKEVARAEGLGMWITFLSAGAKMAEKRKERLTWDHVIKAHSAFLALSIPPTDEEGR